MIILKDSAGGNQGTSTPSSTRHQKRERTHPWQQFQNPTTNLTMDTAMNTIMTMNSTTTTNTNAKLDHEQATRLTQKQHLCQKRQHTTAAKTPRSRRNPSKHSTEISGRMGSTSTHHKKNVSQPHQQGDSIRLCLLWKIFEKHATHGPILYEEILRGTAVIAQPK